MGEGVPLNDLGVVVDGATIELEGDWTESSSLDHLLAIHFHDGNGIKE